MEVAYIILEIISTIAFAISGALVAINKKMDIFGVAILGLTTAVGGGIIRDIILGINPPFSLEHPRNAIIAIVTSIIIFTPFIRRRITSKKKINNIIMLIADSLGLGLFTVIGINSVFNAGFNDNIFLAIFLGVITGVGGGVMRDMMAGDKPYIFVKDFYASASIIGALFCTFTYNLIGNLLSMIIGALIIIILRICAAHFKWNLPGA